MDAKNLMKATYYAKVDIAVVGHVPTVIGAKKAGSLGTPLLLEAYLTFTKSPQNQQRSGMWKIPDRCIDRSASYFATSPPGAEWAVDQACSKAAQSRCSSFFVHSSMYFFSEPLLSQV